jgi:hypothetical protein
MLTKTLRFDGKILAVEVCETQSEMEKGLMWVDHLSEDRGMLFKLSSGSQPKFWMKNTFIPLDIAYIDSSMKIIKIDQMQPHSGKSSCDIPAEFAVEAPLGWFQRNQIKSGCKMEMPESNEVRSIIEEILEEIWERPTCFSDIVYRPFSDMFFQKIREMKDRSGSVNEGIIPFDSFTREVLSTDIGEFGIYEGVHVPLDIPIPEEFHRELYESKKTPKGVQLGVPRRGGEAKFHVYVRDPKTKNIKKINFGAKGMSVGINDPARRKSFVARHQCEKKNDKTKAGYWSCRLPRYWKQLGLKKTSFKFW